MTEGYLLATGKTTLPDSGSTKYNRLLSLAKKLYRDWQTEAGADWNSLHQVIGAGTVTATDTFEYDTEIWRVSQREGDFVYITTTADQNIPFKLVPASELYSNRYENTCANLGTSIKFSRTFTSTDQEFGGTINVPAYVKLDDLESTSDDVLIDNPAWLPAAIATRYVMSDAQLNFLYPDLLNQQNDLMTAMKLANEAQDTYVASENFFSVGGEE